MGFQKLKLRKKGEASERGMQRGSVTPDTFFDAMEAHFKDFIDVFDALEDWKKMEIMEQIEDVSIEFGNDFLGEERDKLNAETSWKNMMNKD